MTARLVSPDRKLVLVAGEGDLQAVKKLCSLTSKQVGNIRQLLGWAGVGNCRGDGNDRTERKESENFMLFHSVICLKHDDGTETYRWSASPSTSSTAWSRPLRHELWKQGEHEKPAQWVEGAHWTMEKGEA